MLFDVGAEELGGNGTRKPYTSADVGLKVGFGATPILSVSKNNLESKNLFVFPVPAKEDYITITFQDKILSLVEIVDMQGRILFQKVINSAAYKLDLSAFSKGTYLIKVQGVSKLFVK